MTPALNPMLQGFNDCGCCAGIESSTPTNLENRPGLSAIAYRIGTHSRFLESMLAELSRHPELVNLRTRDRDDFSPALCDAWATLADILTFYQERLANESFLRTATERFSLLQLARLIGYELAPGVAADTYLAFTLEEAPGSPKRSTIDVGVKVQSVPGPGEKAQTFETVEKLEARAEWNAIKPVTTKPISIIKGTKELYLKGTNTQLQRGDAILIIGDERLKDDTGSEMWDFRLLDSVTPIPDKDCTHITWDLGLGSNNMSPAAKSIKVYALRQRAALFGHNATDPRTLRVRDYSLLVAPSYVNWAGFSIPSDVIDLDLAYPKIVKNSWIVLTTPSPRQTEVCRVNDVSFPSLARFALSGKATRITPDNLEHRNQFTLRDTLVYAQSEELTPIESPDTSEVQGSDVVLNSQMEGIAVGRKLMLSQKDTALQTVKRELVEIAKLEPMGTQTRVTWNAPLRDKYQRDRVTFNANVLAATHGETVEEILGGASSNKPFADYTLRQGPLTYVSAANARGIESTLRVRVNDILWQETPTLFDRQPTERVFATHANDDAKTSVRFGDGVSGAIPPAGQNNVRAVYRKGIGKEGMVKAGQLSLLMTRPLGVRDVVNPEDATGAKDRETLEGARRNAPLTVLTLDRVVSLQDYEDFAQAFAGIGKAQASWVWHRRERGVFLTIAGEDGADVPETSKTNQHLIQALKNAGDPLVPIFVASYRHAYFRVEAKLKIDEAYLPDKVGKDVEARLRERFSFDRRAFGQAVMLSEVVAVIQQVAGVVAVDVDAFYRGKVKPSPPPPVRLLADLPVPEEGGDARAAELLLLDPDPLDSFGTMP